PGFYSRNTGLGVDARVGEAGEVAAIWRAHAAADTPDGILLCAPVPAEAEIPETELAAFIDATIARAGELGIRGKEITPFLLNELGQVTSGATLTANVALLRNNVVVA